MGTSARIVAVVMLLAGLAEAQLPVPDHLQCFPVSAARELGRPKAFIADLAPTDSPPFALATGCRITPKPKFLCIDVDKQNVQPSGATLPVTGDATRDYLCYKVKCPNAGGLTGAIVTDQFGEHVITTKPSKYVCAPALYGPAPRPTAAPCNDLGGGQCSDTCPGGQQCLFVPSDFEVVGPPWPVDVFGTNDCRCVPGDFACLNLSPAVCAVAGPGALCPDASQTCVSSGPGACACQP
jgi:hypothetical protein